MRFLFTLILGAALGAGILWQDYALPLLDQAKESASTQISQLTGERDKALASLAKAQDELAALRKAAEMPQVATSVSVASPAPPTPSGPKQAIRDAAVGEKLDQLVTAKDVYTGVTIKAVDPSGIDIVHDAGAAHVRFADVDQSWRDRFQYDPGEEAAYLAKKTTEQAKVDGQVQQELASQAQAAPAIPTTSSPLPQATNSPQRPKHQDEIQALQKQIAYIQEKHDAWVNDHHGWPGHPWQRGDIPDEISSAAITDLQEQIAALQVEN